MIRIYILFLLSIAHILLNADNNLQQQLAQLDVSLTALKKQLPSKQQIIIDTIKSIDKLEQILDKLIQSIGLMFFRINEGGDEDEEEEKILDFIKKEVTPAAAKLSQFIALLPEPAQRNEENKKIALYLLKYLENKYDQPLPADYITAFSLYSQSSTGQKPKFLMDILAARGEQELFNTYELLKRRIFLPETFIFIDYAINLNQSLQNIRKKSNEAYENMKNFLSPGKAPYSSNPSLSKEINDFATERFNILENDLKTINQNDETARFIINLFKEAKKLGNQHKDFVKKTADELEKLRTHLYTEIKKAQDSIAKLP